MAIPIDQLVNSGALTYAQTRLSRGDSPSEVLGRLGRRYPSQPTSDLQYLIEIAQRQESLKAEILGSDGLATIGGVPFLPGLSAGEYTMDVAYTAAPTQGGMIPRSFFRLNFDNYDLTLATMYALGAVRAQRGQAAVGGRWRQLKEVIITAGDRIVLDDLYRLFPSMFSELPAEFADTPFPPPITPDALMELAIRIPQDEPSQIVLPSDWRASPHAMQQVEARILFLARG